MNIALPDVVKAALDALEGSGYEAWCVGGCVRDAILGRTLNDYDIATAAPWQETERLCAATGFTVHRTGVKHGTVTVSRDGTALEITTYRTDGSYSDGRHPDAVAFVQSIEEDLARRDFTMNALAYHPVRGLLDCWGGLDDIEARVIRVVGDPSKRFREDGLRVLRGCRFASQLGFSIERNTLATMISHKMMLQQVSAERITHELDALLLGDFVHDALMETIDVIGAIMPEIVACKGFDQHTPYHIYDVWEHIAWVVQRAPATRLARWAALFHDIGKPAALFMDGERGHFFGHARLSAILARDVMNRLLMSTSFIERVVKLVLIHDNQIAATSRSVRKALGRLDGDVEMFRTLIGIKRADALAQSHLSQPRIDLSYELDTVLDEIIAQGEAFTVRQLAINGRDVLALGVEAGPIVGNVLNAALDAVIDGRVANEPEALLQYVATLV
jgi:tRNA nucleotidyltransferase (CCA-adding enzyme)